MIIPRISKAIQKRHTGQSVAIVNGECVAFAANSLLAEQKAVQLGYKAEEVMTTTILGTKAYVLSQLPTTYDTSSPQGS